MRWQTFRGVIVQLLVWKVQAWANVSNKKKKLRILDFSLMLANALSLCTELCFCGYGE